MLPLGRSTILSIIALAAPLGAEASEVAFVEHVLVAEAGSEVRRLLVADIDQDGRTDFLTHSRRDAAPVQDVIVWWENIGTPQDPFIFVSNVVRQLFSCSESIDVFAADLWPPPAKEIGVRSGSCNGRARDTEIFFFDGEYFVDVEVGSLEERTEAVASDVLKTPPHEGSLGNREELLYVTPPHATGTNNSVQLFQLFTEIATVAAGRGFAAAHPADIDGDGDQDVVTSDPDQLSWWKVDEADPDNPTFSESFVWSGFGDEAPLAFRRRAIAAGDLDGDRDDDLLVNVTQNTSPLTGRVSWLENSGGPAPSFTEHVVDDRAAAPGGVALGDLDGDGDLDVVVGTPGTVAPRIEWYENIAGDGSLWSLSPQLVVFGGGSFSVSDVDGDGDDDVLAIWRTDNAASDSEVRLYESTDAGAAGFNIDFGTEYGVPAASYGAASARAGSWNLAGLGATALVDVSGSLSDVTVDVAASTDGGNTGVIPTNDDELLLNDNFFSSGGASWSADLAGLAGGEYRIFLYAPSNGVVPTGDMTVGGVPVASIPGDTGSTLIEGTSWVSVHVTVTGDTLVISGAGSGASGLAGLQVVALPEPSQITLLASGLACVALLAKRRGRG